MKMRFNWGWAVVAAMLVFTFGTAGFVAYAMSTTVDLVRADYYEHSLNHDQTMAARARAIRSGATIAVQDDGANIVLHVTQQNAHGTLTLYRPDAPKLDRVLPIVISDDGTMRVPARDLARGLWHVTADWESDGASYELVSTTAL